MKTLSENCLRGHAAISYHAKISFLQSRKEIISISLEHPVTPPSNHNVQWTVRGVTVVLLCNSLQVRSKDSSPQLATKGFSSRVVEWYLLCFGDPLSFLLCARIPYDQARADEDQVPNTSALYVSFFSAFFWKLIKSAAHLRSGRTRNYWLFVCFQDEDVWSVSNNNVWSSTMLTWVKHLRILLRRRHQRKTKHVQN